MRAGDTLSFWSLTLLLLPGVLAESWDVWYPDPVCTVRGSTVVIPCQYSYPSGYQVSQIMWCQNDLDCIETSYVCHSQNYSLTTEYVNRAECLGDRWKKNCSLKIKNIRKTDAGVYKFRFITHKPDDRWTGQTGVQLNVYELRVVTTSSGLNGTAREGDSVNLTCDTGSCSLSQSEFSWFKDNQPLPETQSTLHINPACYRHSGSYSCALKGYEGTESDAFKLNVQTESGSLHCATFSSAIMLLIVGISVLLLTVAFGILIYVRRRKGKSVTEEDDGGGTAQTVKKNSYATDGSPQTRTTTQEVAPQEEDIMYVSVSFRSKDVQTKCAVKDQEKDHDAIIYSLPSKSAVSHRDRSDDTVIYSCLPP